VGVKVVLEAPHTLLVTACCWDKSANLNLRSEAHLVHEHGQYTPPFMNVWSEARWPSSLCERPAPTKMRDLLPEPIST